MFRLPLQFSLIFFLVGNQLCLLSASGQQVAQWIWREAAPETPAVEEKGQLRHRFFLGSAVVKATLDTAGPAGTEIFVNGTSVGSTTALDKALKVDVTPQLEGWKENSLAIASASSATHRGVAVQLTLDFEYGKRQVITSNGDWKFSAETPENWQTTAFNDAAWARCVALAKLGDPPLGNVFPSISAATAAEEIKVPAGFKVELIRSAGQREGSWICMTKDERGRLYVSPQGSVPEGGFSKESPWGGVWRATLDDAGQVARWEKVPVPIGDCMGMLWAFNSLYLSGSGPDGQGIYRCKDANNDGELDSWTLFKKVPGGNGEHGAHAMAVGPDQQIYVLMGNSTPLVDGLKPGAYKDYAEDDVLPRIKDPVATFFDKVKSPYGYVLKTDADGRSWQLWCGGMRNAYDFDFNEDGELFAYDSDMEWDLGLPWYRPTRVLHLVAGGEYGFREGSAKQPSYYPDTLPAVANIGQGSPTGVKFGTTAKFPEAYRKALFIQDWTYGRILAIWPKPQGSSYRHQPLSDKQDAKPYVEFVTGKGLPVTDMEFGSDGSLYFTTGGRGTQGGLYRVTWVGTEVQEKALTVPETTTAAPELTSSAKTLREERRLLESMLAGKTKTDIATLWPKLGSAELGFTARLVLESLPPATYAAKALAEQDANIAHTALLALARTGEKSQQAAVLTAWAKLQVRNAGDYRTPQISVARHGQPTPELAKQLLSRTNLSWAETMTPEARATHREASLLRVLLNDASVVVSLLPILPKIAPKTPDGLTFGIQEEGIYYARLLSEVAATGFEPEQRRSLFQWLAEATQYKGGNSFQKFMEAIRTRALEKLPATERTKEEAAFQAAMVALQKPVTAPEAPARKFVKQWSTHMLETDLGLVKAGRNFARGKEIFTSMLCAKCHQFQGAGGSIGPDLSGIGGRFAPKDILEALIEPSKTISDQYAAVVVDTNDNSYLGLIANETPETLTIYADAFGETKVSIPVKNIKKREPAKTSLMPAGLLNNLQQDEIFDLLAYMIAAGDEKAPNFQPTP